MYVMVMFIITNHLKINIKHVKTLIIVFNGVVCSTQYNNIIGMNFIFVDFMFEFQIIRAMSLY